MQEACAILVGEHDYRNLCTMDVGNVTHFNRRILETHIQPAQHTTRSLQSCFSLGTRTAPSSPLYITLTVSYAAQIHGFSCMNFMSKELLSCTIRCAMLPLHAPIPHLSVFL